MTTLPKTVGDLRCLNIESLTKLLEFCETRQGSKADWARRAKLVKTVLAEKKAEQDDENWSALADIME